GNCGLAAQLFCAIELNLGKLELRLHAVDFRRGTIKIRLVRARIDHVKEVVFFNDRACLKMNLGNVSRHAWPNLDRFNRIQPPSKFVPFVYLLLGDSNDVNRQSRLLRYRCFLAATSRQKDEQKSGAPSSSIACIKFACGNAATLIWNVRRDMPPNDSFTPRIFSATVSGSPTSSAPVGPSRASKCARVTGGQPRSLPISEKLRA